MAGRTRDVDAAAMPLDDPPRDVQAEAAANGFVAIMPARIGEFDAATFESFKSALELR